MCRGVKSLSEAAEKCMRHIGNYRPRFMTWQYFL